MRCSIAFCEWKASWWAKWHLVQASVPFHIADGIAAYATEQAQAEHQRAVQWAARWADSRQQAGIVLRRYLTDSEDAVVVPMDMLHIDIEQGSEDDSDMDMQ